MVEETIEEIDMAISDGRYCEADDILAENLGLEPDYLIGLLI